MKLNGRIKNKKDEISNLKKLMGTHIS